MDTGVNLALSSQTQGGGEEWVAHFWTVPADNALHSVEHA